MALLNRHLEAYTIIESIIALVIILLTFSFAMVVIINVFKGSQWEKEFIVYKELKNVAAETKTKKLFIDRQIKYEDYEIKITVTNYSQAKNPLTLTIEAYDADGKKITEHHELVVDY